MMEWLIQGVDKYGALAVILCVVLYLLYKYFNRKIKHEGETYQAMFELLKNDLESQKEANKKQTEAILLTQNEIKMALLELTNSTKKNVTTLESIKEALEPSTITMLNNIADAYFDLAKENIVRMIVQIKDENNLDNKELTIKKIKDRVKILHDERNDALGCFSFRGRRFSEFTNDEWIARISKLVENEVYGTVSAKRTWANIDNAYKAIKLEFLKCATG